MAERGCQPAVSGSHGICMFGAKRSGRAVSGAAYGVVSVARSWECSAVGGKPSGHRPAGQRAMVRGRGDPQPWQRAASTGRFRLEIPGAELEASLPLICVKLHPLFRAWSQFICVSCSGLGPWASSLFSYSTKLCVLSYTRACTHVSECAGSLRWGSAAGGSVVAVQPGPCPVTVERKEAGKIDGVEAGGGGVCAGRTGTGLRRERANSGDCVPLNLRPRKRVQGVKGNEVQAGGLLLLLLPACPHLWRREWQTETPVGSLMVTSGGEGGGGCSRWGGNEWSRLKGH